MTTLVLADLCASQRAVLAAMPIVRPTRPGGVAYAPGDAEIPCPAAAGSVLARGAGAGSAVLADGVAE